MIVRCIKLLDINKKEITNSSWLKINQEYPVIEIYFNKDSCIEYRVLSNNGTPIIATSFEFEVISALIPNEWFFYEHPNKKLYLLTPIEFKEIGFWEDYFDREKEAVFTFDSVYKKIKEFHKIP
jgi:hypothetical protein